MHKLGICFLTDINCFYPKFPKNWFHWWCKGKSNADWLGIPIFSNINTGDFFLFNQSCLVVSFQIVKHQIVVERLGFLGNELSLLIVTTSHIVVSLLLTFSLFDRLLKRTWKRSTNQLSQPSCLLIRGTCCTWGIAPDNLSIYLVNMFHLIDFLRQSVTTSGKILPLEFFP